MKHDLVSVSGTLICQLTINRQSIDFDPGHAYDVRTNDV